MSPCDVFWGVCIAHNHQIPSQSARWSPATRKKSWQPILWVGRVFTLGSYRHWVWSACGDHRVTRFSTKLSVILHGWERFFLSFFHLITVSTTAGNLPRPVYHLLKHNGWCWSLVAVVSAWWCPDASRTNHWTLNTSPPRSIICIRSGIIGALGAFYEHKLVFKSYVRAVAGQHKKNEMICVRPSCFIETRKSIGRTWVDCQWIF